MEEKKCRICGCTKEDCSQCIEKTGEPCTWVLEVGMEALEDGPLCSACARRCRMCGFDLVADTCSWIEELENEEGGVCLPCLERFMGHPFSVMRADGAEVMGNIKPGVVHQETGYLRLILMSELTPTPDPESEEEWEDEEEPNRRCRLTGGPRDGQLFRQPGDTVKSRAHVGPPMGVYTFRGDHSSDGREVWVWKEHTR